jgi:hypothetical protein
MPPYSKRYAGGFVDKPSLTTAIDATFLNAVEAALLALFGVAPATNGALVWDGAQFTAANKLTNANIDAAAAIAKSKLDLAGQIVDADIAGSAAISRSKLNFGSGLVNADIAAAAALAISKLAGYPTDAKKVLRGDGSWATGGQDLLASQVLSAATSPFDTNTILGGNIPQTYKKLILDLHIRGAGAATTVGALLRANNDSAANYDYVVGRWTGTSSGTAESFAQTGVLLDNGASPAASAGAGLFSQIHVEILNYADTTRMKTFSVYGVMKTGTASGSINTIMVSGHWRSTAAITRLQVYPTAVNFDTNSSFYLYGVN